MAPVEKECDCPIGIGVACGEKQLRHVDVDAQFLSDLASKRASVCFTRVDLPAGKFPVPFEVDALLPACDEEPILAADDGGDHRN
jgi:hypothetical protein